MGRLAGHDLQHVPVLNDLAVGIEAKDIDAGIVVAVGPDLMAVQDKALLLDKKMRLLVQTLGRENLEKTKSWKWSTSIFPAMNSGEA